VAAAKSALRRDGGDSTDFLWRGEMFHYGKTMQGVWVIGEGIEETQQGLATLDPFTDELPFPGYYEPTEQTLKQMTDSELLVKIAWSDADDGPYHEEVRRRYPRNKGAP
jgi:hypothetical protein